MVVPSPTPRSLSLTLVCALLVAVVVWLALRPSGESRTTAQPEAADPLNEEREQAPVARLAEPEAREEAREGVESAEDSIEPLAAVPARVPDLEAREWITFRVETTRGFPVVGAEIELDGLRTVREPISQHAWRGEPSVGRTGGDGTLRLAYPVWVDLDGETGQISFTVRHPDYATYEHSAYRVAPEIRVVLELGSVLVVSGWIGSPEQVVTDVHPRFSFGVDVGSEDWLPRRDGRLTTTRVPPGSHFVYLEHRSAERGLCFSAITPFELAPEQTLELHLELESARSISGRLGDQVPRPVLDGRVSIAVQMRSDDWRTMLLRRSYAEIRQDGTFELAGLLAGEAQLVALCRGWASVRELVPVPGDSGQVSLELVPPAVDPDAPSGELVVAMEPTAALEVVARGPDGAPLEGLEVAAWPNACWRVGACGMYLDDRSWSAVTDRTGHARVDDIPAGDHNWGVLHAEWDLPLDPPGASNARRFRRTSFESGRTSTVEVMLERKP